jgi:hypothetical protein
VSDGYSEVICIRDDEDRKRKNQPEEIVDESDP